MKILRFSIIIALTITLVTPILAKGESLYIRDIRVELLNDGQAKISWVTNIPATGGVLYGENGQFNNYLGSSLTNTWQEVLIVALKSKVTYSYKIVATTDGQTTQSFANTFKTGTIKYVRDLTISNVKAVYVGGTVITVQWETDRDSNSILLVTTAADYLANGLTKAKKTTNRTKTTKHEVTATRLKTNTTYYYQAVSQDSDSNQVVSQVRQFSTWNSDLADKSGLMIDKIAPASSPDPLITSEAVTFIWHTNRPALGYVEIRPEQRGKKIKVSEQSFSVIDHSLAITGLSPNTSYIFKIYARDILGKKYTTFDRYIRTSLTGAVLGAYTTIPNNSGAIFNPPAVQSGLKYYTEARRNLVLEQQLAQELYNYLKVRYNGKVPPISRDNWFILVRAFTYGGYSSEAIVKAVKFGGKTVHPKIFWGVWQNSADYQSYINR
ncbi:MAG: fibronectin type III domain-containing protein [Patescibacteria group bacterium]